MTEIGGVVNSPVPNLVGEKRPVKTEQANQKSAIIEEQSLAQVLEQLEMPKEAVYEKIAKSLLAYQQPLQKEALEEIKTLLQQLTGNQDDNLELLAFLKSKDIPLSKDLVRELQKNITEKNLGTLLKKLTGENELPVLKDIWSKLPVKTQQKLVDILSKLTEENAASVKPEKETFIQKAKAEIFSQDNGEVLKEKLPEVSKRLTDLSPDNKGNKSLLLDQELQPKNKPEFDLLNNKGLKNEADKQLKNLLTSEKNIFLPGSKASQQLTKDLGKLYDLLADEKELLPKEIIREKAGELFNKIKEQLKDFPEGRELVKDMQEHLFKAKGDLKEALPALKELVKSLGEFSDKTQGLKNKADEQLKNLLTSEKNTFLPGSKASQQLTKELGRLYDLFANEKEMLPKEIIREKLGELLDKTGEQLKELPAGKEILKNIKECVFQEQDVLKGDFQALKELVLHKKDTLFKLEQLLQKAEGGEKEVLVKILQDFKTTIETENLLKFQQIAVLLNGEPYQTGIKVLEEQAQDKEQAQVLKRVVLHMETSHLGEVYLNLGVADNQYLYLSFGVEDEKIGQHLAAEFNDLQARLKGLNYQVDEINYQVNDKGSFLALLLDDEKLEKLPELQKVDILT